MSSLDFSAMVRDSLGQNPFLETDEGADVDDPPAESAVPAADYDEADGSGPNAAAADVAIGANEGNDGNDRDSAQPIDVRTILHRAILDEKAKTSHAAHPPSRNTTTAVKTRRERASIASTAYDGAVNSAARQITRIGSNTNE